jgi:uncharacterized membrane protein YuzA (DUF378 family)
MLNQATLKLIATILVIVGSLNWLVIGIQRTNLVAQIAGPNSNLVYIAVGAAGIYLAYLIGMRYKESGRIEAYEDEQVYNMDDNMEYNMEEEYY